jgi:hypothetical protein
MPLFTAALAGFTLTLGLPQSAPIASIADIFGRVLEDVTLAPVDGATVFLYPVPFPPGHRPRASSADHNGEYSFIGIPEGVYRLGLYHEEYFPTLDMSDTSVRLRRGERHSPVELMMSRGGAQWPGRGPSGAPLGNVAVSAVQVRGPRFRQAWPSVHSDRTNALGEFRVSGLKPGKWVVVAHHQPAQNDFAVKSSRNHSPITLARRTSTRRKK